MTRTALLLAAVCLGGCSLEPPAGDAQGPALYETCTPCHGADGAGMQTYGAPAIAGLPEWYVRAQLEKFQSGARGAHRDDVQGLRMRGMARSLNHDGDVEAVAAFVAAMPATVPAATLQGDAAHGRELYATCVQCHGERATGDEARGAPPLAGQSDWYLVAQLGSFQRGLRGTSPLDASGATMRPMTLGLDEAGMRDLAAHIRTLGGP